MLRLVASVLEHAAEVEYLLKVEVLVLRACENLDLATYRDPELAVVLFFDSTHCLGQRHDVHPSNVVTRRVREDRRECVDVMVVQVGGLIALCGFGHGATLSRIACASLRCVTDRLITDEFPTPVGWSSGHLQTIRSRVVRRSRDLDRDGTSRSLLVDLADGTGDKLAVQVHRSRRKPVNPSVGGLVVLVHGTEDLRAVLRELADEPEAAVGPHGEPRLAMMGFSLGGSMTIKLMGEPHEGLPIFAAVAVSAPLDLTVGSAYLNQMGFGLYEKFLVAGLKRQALQPGPRGTLRVSPQEHEAIRAAKDLAEFDDALTAPRNGWRDAKQYYEVNSSGPYLTEITEPTLVIHSVDDPMIPASPYGAIDWDALEANGIVQRRITPHGGHVGFHERGRNLPWYVGQAVRFLWSVYSGD